MSETLQIPQLIEDVEELLSLPDVVMRANELIDSETADVESIAEVIALDPSLTAQLLKLVNSAFYGLPSKIETISRAITVIGMQELRSLILSASAVEVFNKVAPEAIDMNDFWFRSIYVGLAAKQISGDRRKAEMFFLTGLMHDVGKIVLFMKHDAIANEMLREAMDSDKSLHQIEKEKMGFTASQVSSALLQNWGLAETLYGPIAIIYENVEASPYLKDAAILRLAARLSDCTEPEVKGKNAEKLSVVMQDSQLLKAAGVKADDLEDIMNDVNLYCFDVLSVINPEASLVF
jgi:HD-like signal output (HDOD) protein